MNKSIDPLTIKLPDDMPSLKKENIFFSKWIEKISTKRKINKRLLIITEWEFYILKKKIFHKKLILSYAFKWFDIISIENNDPNPQEFTINFKNDKRKKKGNYIKDSNKNAKKRTYFTFKYPKTQQMLKMFYKYIVSFQIPNNLPEFNYPPLFPFPNAKGSIPDIIRMRLRLNNHRISNSTLNTLKKFLNSEPTQFCFTEIRSIINYLPIFLECIYLEPSIKTLIVPFNSNFNFLEILINFLKENQSITSLTFKGELPEKFSEFKSEFLSLETTQVIQSFKFVNSKFSIENVKCLSKIVNKRNILSLQMKNSLGPLSMPPFLDFIYNNPGFKNIKKFEIDQTFSIQIRNLMPYLKNVTSLTLIDCGFEIADFFAVLDLDFQIKYLNISQNYNDKRIFNKIVFPQFLSILVMKKIIWDELSLEVFFDSLMSHKHKVNDPSLLEKEIKLDISHISMSDEDWNSFFNKLDLLPGGKIVELKWNDNLIDKHFISFINSFDLRTLSLDGCSARNDDDLLELHQFIANTKTIENLSFAGTELRKMRKQILSIIDTLYFNRSIKKINVSNHNCGNSILNKLCDVLLANRVIDEISFDNNNINDIHLYEHFLDTMLKRGKPLYIEFPNNFIKSVYQYGDIGNDEIAKIKNLYNSVILGNTQIKIPKSTVETNPNSKVKFKMKRYENDDDDDDIDYNQKTISKIINRKKKLNNSKRLKNISDESNNNKINDIDNKISIKKDSSSNEINITGPNANDDINEEDSISNKTDIIDISRKSFKKTNSEEDSYSIKPFLNLYSKSEEETNKSKNKIKRISKSTISDTNSEEESITSHKLYSFYSLSNASDTKKITDKINLNSKSKEESLSYKQNKIKNKINPISKSTVSDINLEEESISDQKPNNSYSLTNTSDIKKLSEKINLSSKPEIKSEEESISHKSNTSKSTNKINPISQLTISSTNSEEDPITNHKLNNSYSLSNSSDITKLADKIDSNSKSEEESISYKSYNKKSTNKINLIPKLTISDTDSEESISKSKINHSYSISSKSFNEKSINKFNPISKSAIYSTNSEKDPITNHKLNNSYSLSNSSDIKKLADKTNLNSKSEEEYISKSKIDDSLTNTSDIQKLIDKTDSSSKSEINKNIIYPKSEDESVSHISNDNKSTNKIDPFSKSTIFNTNSEEESVTNLNDSKQSDNSILDKLTKSLNSDSILDAYSDDERETLKDYLLNLYNKISDINTIDLNPDDMENYLLPIDHYEIDEQMASTYEFIIYNIMKKNSNTQRDNDDTSNLFTAINYNLHNGLGISLNKFKEYINKLSKINYPSVLKFIGFSPVNFRKQPNPVIIGENAERTLESVISRNSAFNQDFTNTKKLINIFGIASAMKYLHSLNLTHSNLHSRNILLDESNYPKVIISIEDMNKKIKHCAPKILNNESFDNKPDDVYAFSMLVYEIITNKKPFDDNNNKNNRPVIPSDVPSCFKNLINSCWSTNPENRPTFDEIVKLLKIENDFIKNDIDKKEYLAYILNIIYKIPLIDFTDFSEHEQINKGMFGKAYLLTCKNSEEQIIGKVLSEEYGTTLSSQNFFNEIEIMSKLNHPSVLKLKGFNPVDFDNELHPTIFSSFIPNGSLSNLINQEKKSLIDHEWDDTKKLMCIFGIASGMKYLHSLNIIHRDLKPDNILIDENYHPVICDFGLSIFLDDYEKEEKKPTVIGTPLYIAPEIWRDYNYSKAADVYAFGMIVYEIMTNDQIFKEVNNFRLMKKILNGERPTIKRDVPIGYRNLIESCWDDDIDNRPTFSQIIDTIITKIEDFYKITVNISEFKVYVEDLEGKLIIFDENEYIRRRKREEEEEEEAERKRKEEEEEAERRRMEEERRRIEQEEAKRRREEEDIIDNDEQSHLLRFVNALLPSVNKFDLNRFEVLGKIGDGSFGTVLGIMMKETNECFAAKELKIELINLAHNDLNNLIREININSIINHPSIVKFYGYSPTNFTNEIKPVIITEIVQNGTLSNILKKEREGLAPESWNETKKFIIIYGIATAMKYMHSKSIIHRDLKPDNILLDENFYPKIADLGLSKDLNQKKYFDIKSGPVGTPSYMAPEIWQEFPYDQAVDVYAFSYILYEIVTGENPFDGLDYNRLMRNLLMDEKPEFKIKIPECYEKLIKICWEKDPGQRPSFEQIVDTLLNNEEFTKNIDIEDFNNYKELVLNEKNIEDYKPKKIIYKNDHKIFNTTEQIDEAAIKTFIRVKEEQLNCSKINEYFANLNQYQKQDLLMKSEFSKVYKVVDKNSGEIYAARISNINMNQFNEDEMNNISKELSKISELDHPTIVKFIGFSPKNFQNESKPVMITEITSNRTLYDIFKMQKKGIKNDEWNSTKKLINIYGIAAGMKYLHSNDIINRNLNPMNIILDDSLHPKLTNFGLCTQLLVKISMTSQSACFLDNNKIYTAPELFDFNYILKENDVYNYALIVYEIVTSEKPYNNYKNYFTFYNEVVKKGLRPKIKKYVPKCYKKLIQSCWSVNPTIRPTFDDIIDILKNDPEFLTPDINKEEYFKYINEISKK